MQNDEALELEHVTTALGQDGAVSRVRWEKLQLFEIGPSQFLSFAKQDLEEDSERGRLNGINNAKRAIACRVDEILTLSHLRVFMMKERWGLPYKLEVIKKLGCPGPYVLRDYITSKRNTMEHEYRQAPDADQVKYVSDITELFLRATDGYVAKGCVRSATIEVHDRQEEIKQRWKTTRIVQTDDFSLDFDHGTDTLKLGYSRNEETAISNLRTGAISSSGRCLARSAPRTLRLADCSKEQLTDIERLVRETLEG